MAKITLQSTIFASVIFLFITLFGYSIVSSHYISYGVDIDPEQPNLSSFSAYRTDWQEYSGGVENTSSEIVLTEADSEGTKGSASSIFKLVTARSTTTEMLKDTKGVLTFVPDLVWELLLILVGLLFVLMLVVILWRYSPAIRD